MTQPAPDPETDDGEEFEEDLRSRSGAMSVVQLVLLVVAFLIIARAVAHIDLEDLADELRDANWWLVALGMVVAQAPRPTAALSSMGASPVPIRFLPMYLLQLALSYIGLVVPGSAARFAVNVRFFQRTGMPAGTAVAASALDSAVWFAVLGALLGGMLLFTSSTLEVDFDSSTSSGLSRLLLVVIVLGLVALVAVGAVPRWRAAVVARIRQFAADAREATRGVMSPSRISMLLGGNLATALLFAAALGIFGAALGHPISFLDALFIHVSVALLAGVLPVPGGIGVVEAGLTFGLARTGIPEDAAFAIAILFRIATFYLPPAWGVFALRWLERNRHL